MPDGDLTTRARIRDAAVDLIGTRGFDKVTIRQVAHAADVSPGLVIHHFGSKEGLRLACDARVRQVLSDSIAELEQHGPASAMAQLARADEYLPVVRYGTRALRDGGPLAQALFDQLVGETEGWLRASVAAGHVVPSADDHARATVLVCLSLGIQMLGDYLVPGADPEHRTGAVVESVAGAAVELYTRGLFTTTEYLDAFTARGGSATPGPSAPAPPTPRRRGRSRSRGPDKEPIP